MFAKGSPFSLEHSGPFLLVLQWAGSVRPSFEAAVGPFPFPGVAEHAQFPQQSPGYLVSSDRFVNHIVFLHPCILLWGAGKEKMAVMLIFAFKNVKLEESTSELESDMTVLWGISWILKII